MESAIQIFEHEKFGKVRVIMIDGNPYFVAADVCRVIELKIPSDILKRLDDDEKCKVPESRVVTDPILNIGSEKREINLVNEPGLYRLIFSSRKPEAREFQRWVYHEVLPAIHKYGYYSLVTATKPAPVVRKPNPKRRAAQLADARVYIAQINNGTVKIGNSKDVDDRKSRLQTKYKLTVKKTHHSSLFPRKIARAIEKALHNIFSSFKVDGEFFNVEYEFACTVLDALERLINSLPYVFDSERGEKLLAIADMMPDSVEKQTLLTQTANLFIGKKFD